jgi:chaperonin GroES
MPTKKTKEVEVKSNVPVPFQDRIIISKVTPETKTASGLFLPPSAIEEENKGIVVAIGPLVGKALTNASVLLDDTNTATPKVGDTVVFGEYAGISIPNTPYLIVKEADVLAKV